MVNFSPLGANATYTIRKNGTLPASRIDAAYLRVIVPFRLNRSTLSARSFDIPLQPPLQGRILASNGFLIVDQPISTEAAQESEKAETDKAFIYIGFMVAYF